MSTKNVKSLIQLQREEPDRKVIAEYERVLAEDPTHLESLLGMARVQMRLREYEGALRTTREALRVTPNEAEAHYLMGWVYIYQKEYARAAQCFRTAVSLEPDEARYHIGLGSFLFRQWPEEALTHTEAAYCLDPQSLGAHPRFALWHARIFAGYGPNRWLVPWGCVALLFTVARWAGEVPVWYARFASPYITRGLGVLIKILFMSVPFVAAIGVQLHRRRYRRAVWAFVLWALWGFVMWLLPL